MAPPRAVLGRLLREAADQAALSAAGRTVGDAAALQNIQPLSRALSRGQRDRHRDSGLLPPAAARRGCLLIAAYTVSDADGMACHAICTAVPPSVHERALLLAAELLAVLWPLSCPGGSVD